MRALVPAVLMLVALGVAAEAGPRRGKVVRIERRRLAAAPGIHVCIRQPPHDHLLCVGARPPLRGERIALVGLTGTPLGGTGGHEIVEVDRSEPAPEDDCGTGLIHAVHTVPSAAATADPLIGFRGVKVDPGAKVLLQPDLRPLSMSADEQPMLGLDADGDGRADLLVTQRDCADAAARLGARGALCWTYYRHDAVDWRLVGEDVLAHCRRP